VLCGGLLSGKYHKGQPSPGDSARFNKYPDYMSRWSPNRPGGGKASEEALSAVEDYARIAEEAGLSLTELSIRWARTRSYIGHGSVLVGATSTEQLRENLDAFEGPPGLSDEVLAEIDAVHMRCRNPGTAL